MALSFTSYTRTSGWNTGTVPVISVNVRPYSFSAIAYDAAITLLSSKYGFSSLVSSAYLALRTFSA